MDPRYADGGQNAELTEQVNVKLTPDDYQQLDAAVDASPYETPAEYARAVLRAVTDPDEELSEVLRR